ncbi:MAG: hypothetical protein AAGB11_16360 [Pseudomonadota bacterium]
MRLRIVQYLREHKLVLLLLLVLVAVVVAGPTTFARLAHRAGAPALALPWTSDEAVRGAMLYDLGRYGEADDIFRTIGRSVTYNRGNTLAATGDHKLAVAYFDAVLFANRFDGDARHNRDVVAALVPPHVGEAMGRGRIRASLKQSGIDAQAFDAENPHVPVVPKPDSVRKPIDARTVAASREWLETLKDAPGVYLRKRLLAEYDRRRAASGPTSPEPSPW